MMQQSVKVYWPGTEHTDLATCMAGQFIQPS